MNSESADDPERGIRRVIQRADGRSMRKHESVSAETSAEDFAENLAGNNAENFPKNNAENFPGNNEGNFGNVSGNAGGQKADQ